MAIYFHDVTAVRQAAESLRESEERFRLLSKATNDAIWDWDLATDMVWWNQGFEILFGFSPEERDPSLCFWKTKLHPADQARVVGSIRAAINSGQESWAEEYRFQRKDGSYAYVLDRGHIIHDASGNPVRMIGGMTDLTQRKQAEEYISQQAALIDEARDAICVCSLDHRILFWNKGAERLFGYTASEAQGRILPELLPLEQDKFQKANRIVRETGGWNGEIEKQARDGAVLKLDGRWTLLKDAEGQPERILILDTDITDRRRLEEQFLRSQRMESIGTLAGGIAHDLNNALAPIMMSIDLLKTRIVDPECLDLLAMISTSAKQGAEMVQQVLYFARGVKSERTEVSVRELVKDIGRIAQETFPKNITISTDIPAGLWLVSGDVTQLHQVLLNLCVNARDAMPSGGSLTISARNVEVKDGDTGFNPEAKPGQYVELLVRDTGSGMSPEIVSKIFEPFFTTKETGKGTGLGLSTSIGIVKSHGGFIDVQSAPDKGTVFTVHLPALGSVSTETTAVPQSSLPPEGRGQLILVVDDELLLRRLTQQTLEAHGYRVLLASDGAEAVTVFHGCASEVAAVVTDMMMPVMDGPAAIELLRRIRPDIPIIAVSGLSEDDNHPRAEQLGVRHFLQKPYPAGALLELLDESWPNKRMRLWHGSPPRR